MARIRTPLTVLLVAALTRLAAPGADVPAETRPTEAEAAAESAAAGAKMGPANKPLPALPRNASLVIPMGNSWQQGVRRASNRLGGRVACVVIFASESDVHTVGPMSGACTRSNPMRWRSRRRLPSSGAICRDLA